MNPLKYIVMMVLVAVMSCAAACGVKGPPLPPLAATPEDSDVAVRPSPGVSSLPMQKNKKKR